MASASVLIMQPLSCGRQGKRFANSELGSQLTFAIRVCSNRETQMRKSFFHDKLKI